MDSATGLVVGMAAGTLALNLPFGFWRSRARKFSLPWVVFVHAPVPLVIAARLWLGVGWGAVPFLVAAAVTGQILGGRSNPG